MSGYAVTQNRRSKRKASVHSLAPGHICRVAFTLAGTLLPSSQGAATPYLLSLTQVHASTQLLSLCCSVLLGTWKPGTVWSFYFGLFKNNIWRPRRTGEWVLSQEVNGARLTHPGTSPALAQSCNSSPNPSHLEEFEKKNK